MAATKINLNGIHELDLNFGGSTTASVSQGVVTVNNTPSASIDLQTNSVDNGNQGKLNLKNGTNVTITDDGVGGVTIAAASPPAGVTSVALTVPSRQTVTGSPVTSTGTLAISDNTQSPNIVFAGPTTGAAAVPTFRSLVPADLPIATTSALGAVSVDNTTIAVSGGGQISTIAPSGTANKVYATPNGSTGLASLRALVAADLPLATTGAFGAVKPDGTTITISGGIISAPAGGTVSSVAMTVPSRQTVTGSPVTTTGTFAVTDNTQNANLVFAGPSSGGAATPTFRAIAAADLPLATTGAFGAVKPDGTSVTISGGIISAAPAAATNWNAITNPTGNLALTMAANTSTFTYNAATGAAVDMFKITDTTSNTGTGALLSITKASLSSAIGLRIKRLSNGGTVPSIQIENQTAAVTMKMDTADNSGGTGSAYIDSAGGGFYLTRSGWGVNANIMMNFSGTNASKWLVTLNSQFDGLSAGEVGHTINNLTSLSATSGAFLAQITNNGTSVLVVSPSMTTLKNTLATPVSAAKTTTYSVTAADSTILCNGTFTVTLPTSGSWLQSGARYIIKNIGVGTITVSAGGTINIDGATTQTLTTQYSILRVQWNGTQYYTI